jgi:hypothetical protein
MTTEQMIESIDTFMKQRKNKFKNFDAHNLIVAVLMNCDYTDCSSEDLLQQSLKNYNDLKQENYI